MGKAAWLVFWVGLTVAIYFNSPTVQAEVALLWVALGELASEWRTLLVTAVVLFVLALGLRWVLDKKYDKHN